MRTESLAYHLALGRMNTVRQFVAPGFRKAALEQQDLDELASACAEFPETVRAIWEAHRDEAFRDRNTDLAALLDLRLRLERLTDEHTQTVETILDLARQQSNGAGQPSTTVAQLEQVITRLRALKTQQGEAWLVANREEVEEALAAARRGESLELEDAFAEIAGVDRETWLRRVEEHKQRRRGA
jgi:hypothetical protein